MTFDQYKAAVVAKKGRPIVGEVRMTTEQFWAMQKQAYREGYREGESAGTVDGLRNFMGMGGKR